MPSATAAEPPPPPAAELSFANVMEGAISWVRKNPLGALLLALCAGVLVYFYGFYSVFMNGAQSTIVWMVKGWNEENDQIHCWLIAPLIFVILWLRRADLKSVVKRPSLRGLVFVFVGLMLFVLGARCLQARVAIVALPLIIYGSAEYLGGKEFARIFIFPCLLILFMVPIGGIVQGTVSLQLLASGAVGKLCSLLGIHIQIIGTKITVDGHDYEVAGGCSGIRSLMAMTLLVATYAYFVMPKTWQKLVLFGASIIFALVGNVGRLFSVVLVSKYWDAGIAGGAYHDNSGFVFFIVAVLSMVAFGNLLTRDWSQAGARIGKVLTAPDAPDREVPQKDVNEVEDKKKSVSPISYDY